VDRYNLVFAARGALPEALRARFRRVCAQTACWVWLGVGCFSITLRAGWASGLQLSQIGEHRRMPPQKFGSPSKPGQDNEQVSNTRPMQTVSSVVNGGLSNECLRNNHDEPCDLNESETSSGNLLPWNPLYTATAWKARMTIGQETKAPAVGTVGTEHVPGTCLGPTLFAEFTLPRARQPTISRRVPQAVPLAAPPQAQSADALALRAVPMLCVAWAEPGCACGADDGSSSSALGRSLARWTG
jgi:hypothetical protein